MLISPIIYYLLDFVLFTVLAYDTFGYLVALHKKHQVPENDYSRLVFTWLFTVVVSILSSWLSFVPLADEAFLGLELFLTLPVLCGSLKLKKILIDERLVCKLVSSLGLCGESENCSQKSN